jgi:hypothetical protein
MKIIVFWDVTSCMFRRFRGTCFPHYPTNRRRCAKSQNTALVWVPYVSLCVTSVGLVCPHCEDVPNVDSHSGVRIYVAVLVVGYSWPLADECTKLKILFCFVSASKGWWAFLMSCVQQKHSFGKCWQIYQVTSFVLENISFPMQTPLLRVIIISVHI